jgi:predicted signal transduction protein with EAL and GGDEF domain
MRQKFEIESHEIYVACSIGVSLFPDDAEDAETLLKNADMAMYRAKEMGKNNCQSFTKSMAAEGQATRMLENALRAGIQRQELSLRFQPKVHMTTQRIVGAEALVRWHHPTRGVVLPGEFIHIAEETGLIHDIGFWVLEATLRTLREWQSLGIHDVPVAVNIAAGQFRAPNLAERILDSVAKSGISPQLLEFEITETGLIRDPEGVGRALHQLRSGGMRVAIDDFGTGYSSLSHLKRFPIDSLKIDRSFVADLLKDPDDRAIVSAVTALAHALDIDVVAEGVETEAQRDMLQRLGCHSYQGYLFAVPLTSAEFVQKHQAQETAN